MSKLIYLVGPSCSGKSTLAKRMMERGEADYIANADSIRINLYGEYRMGNREEENLVFKLMDTKIEELLKMGKTVINDNPNLNERFLRESMNRFNHLAELEFIFMEGFDKRDLIKRNQKRYEDTGILIPLHVIESQLKNYPTIAEMIGPNKNIPQSNYPHYQALNKYISERDESNISIKEAVQMFCSDFNNPLDQRWEMFIGCKLGGTCTNIPTDFYTLTPFHNNLEVKDYLKHTHGFNNMESIAYDTILDIQENIQEDTLPGRVQFINSITLFKEFMMNEFIYEFNVN